MPTAKKRSGQTAINRIAGVDPAALRPFSVEWDIWRARECGMAIAWWLDARGAVSNQIKTLDINDFAGMADAAIARYIEIREHARKHLAIGLFDPMPDEGGKHGE